MWIIPSVCDGARLEPLLAACRATGMIQPARCLVDLRRPFQHDPAHGRRLPHDWTLIPALGVPEAAEVVRILRSSAPPAPFYGILPVDHRPLTPGWDRALSRAAGEWQIACCHDALTQGKTARGGMDRATGLVCIGGALAHAMGELIPAGMSLDDARLAWMALGRSLGIVRHLGTVAVDRRPGPDYVAPRAELRERPRLFRWLNDEMKPMAARLREAMARAAHLAAQRTDAAAIVGPEMPMSMVVHAHRAV
jgi:hypothetical protein